MQTIILENRRTTIKAVGLLAASLADYQQLDPSIAHTPKALEPYDALLGRFDRAVDCALRYFRSRELLEFTEESDTTRDLLSRMEKLDLVSEANLWIAMRNVRHRIGHDYLPEQTAELFDLIISIYGNVAPAPGETNLYRSK